MRYKKVWGKKQQVVFNLYSEGLFPMEIAEKDEVKKLGLTLKTVRNIIDSTGFQDKHNEVVVNALETARKVMEARLVEAVGQIIRLMKRGKPDERIKLDAAKEILNQCGMRPIEITQQIIREYSPEELKSSLDVIKEVQAIEETLSTQGSGFLIKRDTPLEPDLIEDGTKETSSEKEIELSDEIKTEAVVIV